MEKTIQAAAPSLPELFTRVAQEVTALLVDPETIGEALREKVVEQADTLDALMQAWAEKILELRRAEMVFRQFDVGIQGTAAEGWRLDAVLTGELIDPDRHGRRPCPHPRCEQVSVNGDSPYETFLRIVFDTAF